MTFAEEGTCLLPTSVGLAGIPQSQCSLGHHEAPALSTKQETGALPQLTFLRGVTFAFGGSLASPLHILLWWLHTVLVLIYLPCYIHSYIPRICYKIRFRACAELSGYSNPSVPASVNSFQSGTRICYSYIAVCNPHPCS